MINGRGKGAKAPLCKCGCGYHTKLITQTSFKRGKIAGNYEEYLPYHGFEGHNKKPIGSTRLNKGYVVEKTKTGKWLRQHRLIAERVLGKKLKKSHQVHHVDTNKENNENKNLVICENQSYHELLHRRLRALLACGHADWMKCERCKEWCDPKTLDYIRPGGKYGRHNDCEIIQIRHHDKEKGTYSWA